MNRVRAFGGKVRFVTSLVAIHGAFVAGCTADNALDSTPLVTPSCSDGDDQDHDGFGVGCPAGNDCDDDDPSSTNECYECAGPSEGCPCDHEGREIRCGELHTTAAGQASCGYGRRACAGGSWGECVLDPTLEPQGLGMATGCPNNPCDPYCKQFPDTPDSSLSGDNVEGSDDGLSLVPATKMWEQHENGPMPASIKDTLDQVGAYPSGDFFYHELNPGEDSDKDPFEIDGQTKFIDVYILHDTSATMGEALKELGNQLAGASGVVAKVHQKFPSARFGVGHFHSYQQAPYDTNPSGGVVSSLWHTLNMQLGDVPAANVLTFLGNGGTTGNDTSTEGFGVALFAASTDAGLYRGGAGASQYWVNPRNASGSYSWVSDYGGAAPPAAQMGPCPNPAVPGQAGQGIAYPCFAPGSKPILIVVTDNPSENGPNGMYALGHGSADATFSSTGPIPGSVLWEAATDVDASQNGLEANAVTVDPTTWGRYRGTFGGNGSPAGGRLGVNSDSSDGVTYVARGYDASGRHFPNSSSIGTAVIDQRGDCGSDTSTLGRTGREAFFKFTLAEDSFVHFDTMGSALNTILYIIDGKGAGTCGHQVCDTGGPLDSACEPCVAAICAADPSCCSAGWTQSCIDMVSTVCHPPGTADLSSMVPTSAKATGTANLNLIDYTAHKAQILGTKNLTTLGFTNPSTAAQVTGNVDITAAGLYGAAGTVNGKTLVITLNGGAQQTVTFAAPANYTALLAQINAVFGGTFASKTSGGSGNRLLLKSPIAGAASTIVISASSTALGLLGHAAGTWSGLYNELNGKTLVLSINGAAVQTVTFSNPANSTAIATQINTVFGSGFAASTGNPDNVLRLKSLGAGASESITVDASSTSLSLLGLSVGSAFGSPSDLDGKTLILQLNGGATQTVTFAAPTSTTNLLAQINAVVGGSIASQTGNPDHFLRITSSTTGASSSVVVDGASTSLNLLGLTAATIVGADSPLSGEQLVLQVDGGANQTVTFSNPSNSAAVATQINSQVTGVTAAIVSNKLQLTSKLLGDSSSITIVTGTTVSGGSSLVDLGFAAGQTLRFVPCRVRAACQNEFGWIGSGGLNIVDPKMKSMANLNARLAAGSYTLVIDEVPTGTGCPSGYTVAGNGHCYKYVTTPLSWTAAKADCATKSATLATIDSNAKDATLVGMFSGLPSDTVHIGAKYDSASSSWGWESGDAFAYTNWAAGQPLTNDCGARLPDGTWASEDCGASGPSRSYLCEFVPVFLQGSDGYFLQVNAKPDSAPVAVPTFDQGIDAMNAIGAKMIGIDASGMGPIDATGKKFMSCDAPNNEVGHAIDRFTYLHLQDAARRTGSVDSTNPNEWTNPFVFAMNNKGGPCHAGDPLLGDQIVDSLTRLTETIRQDVSVVAHDIDDDIDFDYSGPAGATPQLTPLNLDEGPQAGFPYGVFIKSVTAIPGYTNGVNGSGDVIAGVPRCLDDPSTIDVIEQCVPDTAVKFDVVFTVPSSIVQEAWPQIFKFNVEVRASGSEVVGSKPAVIVVPPSTQTVYEDPGTFVRDYDTTNVCPEGTSVVWGVWSWGSQTPGDSRIDFSVATSDSLGGLDTAPLDALQFANPPGPGALAGQPIGAHAGVPNTQAGATIIDTTLALKGRPRKSPFLRVVSSFLPSTDQTKTPLLEGWNMEVSCPPTE